MTEYQRQKVVDFITALDDEEKAIAAEILEKWKSKMLLRKYLRETKKVDSHGRE